MINMMMSNICALMRCDDAPFQPHSSSDFKICMEIGTQMGNPFSYGHKLTKNVNQFDVLYFVCIYLNQWFGVFIRAGYLTQFIFQTVFIVVITRCTLVVCCRINSWMNCWFEYIIGPCLRTAYILTLLSRPKLKPSNTDR